MSNRETKIALSRRSFLRGIIGFSGALSCSGILEAWFLKHSAQAAVDWEYAVPGPQFIAVNPAGQLFVSSVSPEGRYRIIGIHINKGKFHEFGAVGISPIGFNFPQGIAFDSDGNLYVVDSNNGRVNVYNSTFQPLHSIGALGPTPGFLHSPQGIAITPEGLIFVADTRNHRLQVWDNKHQLIKVIGSLGDGDDQFRLPTDVAFDSSGFFYVVDSKHHCLKKFTQDGKFQRKIERQQLVPEAPESFSFPVGATYSRKRNLIYFTDTMNNRVVGVSPLGEVRHIVTKGMRQPQGLVAVGDVVAVADTGNNRILCFAV